MLNQATRTPQNASPALEIIHSAIAHESKRASPKNHKIRRSKLEQQSSKEQKDDPKRGLSLRGGLNVRCLSKVYNQG